MRGFDERGSEHRGRGPRRGPRGPFDEEGGRGGWGGPPPPPPGPGFRGGHRFHRDEEGRGGHRGRTRRGEIRTALLTILAESPGHGYELIQRIEDKTEGAWKPSPGSVYPTLQLLEDEGLVTAVARDGKRVYELTDAGRTEAEQRIAAAGDDPWGREGRGRPQAVQLFDAMKGVALAAKQVVMAGHPTQIEAATEIMKDARKKLYQLLAAD
jgi:DNA-binding PadR family transcriptional regulator